MVFHGFKGESKTDDLIKQIPKGQQSQFVKRCVEVAGPKLAEEFTKEKDTDPAHEDGRPVVQGRVRAH